MSGPKNSATRMELVEAFIPHSPVAAAHAVDLGAEARIVRRGRRLSSCEIDVTDPDSKLIAHGIATYQLS